MKRILILALLALAAAPVMAQDQPAEGGSSGKLAQATTAAPFFRNPESAALARYGVPQEAGATVCLDGLGCIEITAIQAAKVIAEQEAAGLCGICPYTQEPPPDPTQLPGFCTGLRDEYAFLDSEWLGGVLPAYNFCIAQGTEVRNCGRQCDPPRVGCTYLGRYTDEYYWSPTRGECVRHCTRCN